MLPVQEGTRFTSAVSRRMPRLVTVALVSVGVIPGTAAAQEEESEPTVPTAPDDWVDPEKDTLEGEGSPLDDLPPHITLVSDVGLRPSKESSQ